MNIKVQDRIYPMQPGDVCLIPPGVSHAEMYSASTPAHYSLWFAYHADTATLYANLFEYDFVGHGQVIQSCSTRISTFIGPLLLELQTELSKMQAHTIEVCHSLFLLLTQLSVRALETTALVGKGTTLSYVSRQVIDYLHEHYASDVSVGDLAKQVHLSSNYLSTVFKQETGKSIGQTLTEIRIQHAKRLLIERKGTVREIAASVGFRSPEHFSRVFQNYENVSPSAYSK